MDRMDELLTRWRALVGDAGAADVIGHDLLARWSEPHRRYHNVEHLRAVLDAIDELADHADDPAVVRMAAWFHDAVYEGRPGADERASATLADAALSRLDVPTTQIAEVVRLVYLTTTHDPADDDRNGAVLCDADLAVLGSDPRAYATYAADVRAEYAHVSDADFRVGRADVLRRLLTVDPLYRTPLAQQRWAASAQRNLTTELALLSVS
jgi:predicted metal-dependent HD superfamily phosphohydrolase